MVSAASFMEDSAQSPSPFFRSVAAEEVAASACFLLFPAATLVVAPSLCFLLGAMEFFVSIGKVASFGEEMAMARNARKKKIQREACKGKNEV